MPVEVPLARIACATLATALIALAPGAHAEEAPAQEPSHEHRRFGIGWMVGNGLGLRGADVIVAPWRRLAFELQVRYLETKLDGEPSMEEAASGWGVAPVVRAYLWPDGLTVPYAAAGGFVTRSTYRSLAWTTTRALRDCGRRVANPGPALAAHTDRSGRRLLSSGSGLQRERTDLERLPAPGQPRDRPAVHVLLTGRALGRGGGPGPLRRQRGSGSAHGPSSSARRSSGGSGRFRPCARRAPAASRTRRSGSCRGSPTATSRPGSRGQARSPSSSSARRSTTTKTRRCVRPASSAPASPPGSRCSSRRRSGPSGRSRGGSSRTGGASSGWRGTSSRAGART